MYQVLPSADLEQKWFVSGMQGFQIWHEVLSLSHLGISLWMTSYPDLVGFDRLLAGSWRSRKGRIDGEGRDVWRGGGKERARQINNGILSVLSTLSLWFCLCVLFRAPTAFPSWAHSGALDIGQTGQLYDCMCLYTVCVFICSAYKCFTSLGARQSTIL